jgi:futalosine hydrolase
VKILIITATEKEVSLLFQKFPKLEKKSSRQYSFTLGNLFVDVLITGVGIPSTIFHLCQHLSSSNYELIINTGIAGSFNDQIAIGSVVQVKTEAFADLGINNNGEFQTVFEAGLIDQNMSPFVCGELINDQFYSYLESLKQLKEVKGITVNTASGHEASINCLKSKFNPDIETMEGAGVFYVASQLSIPFIEIRGISNRVEPRNTKNWNLPLAIIKVNEKLLEILSELELKKR